MTPPATTTTGITSLTSGSGSRRLAGRSQLRTATRRRRRQRCVPVPLWPRRQPVARISRRLARATFAACTGCRAGAAASATSAWGRCGSTGARRWPAICCYITPWRRACRWCGRWCRRWCGRAVDIAVKGCSQLPVPGVQGQGRRIQSQAGGAVGCAGGGPGGGRKRSDVRTRCHCTTRSHRTRTHVHVHVVAFVAHRLIYPNYRGYLKKKGGGTSIFGRRNWKVRVECVCGLGSGAALGCRLHHQAAHAATSGSAEDLRRALQPTDQRCPLTQERFFVCQRGMLSYYDNQEDWEKHRAPLKGIQVTLRFYRIDQCVVHGERGRACGPPLSIAVAMPPLLFPQHAGAPDAIQAHPTGCR